MIKGVIYDLDGTIIDTADIHAAAWQAAAESVGEHFSEELLEKQKGIPNEDAVGLLFPDQTKVGKEKLLEKKNEYISNHFGKFVENKGIKETITELQEKKYKVWVCTGAPKAFVLDVASSMSIVEGLKEKTVWREMYTQGKPSPEPLLVTLKQMGCRASEVIYVGDAWNDYQASKAAEIEFLYFLPKLRKPDPEIPVDVPRLENHTQLFRFIK